MRFLIPLSPSCHPDAEGASPLVAIIVVHPTLEPHMASAARSQGVVNEINVTPMIDVLLVLLVTFMLLTRDRMTIRSPVSLAGRQGDPSDRQLVLQLPDGGGFLLNGQPVPDEVLEPQLAAAFDGRPAKLLFIDAGGERTYQEVVTAMDRARGAGAQVVALMPAAGP